MKKIYGFILVTTFVLFSSGCASKEEMALQGAQIMDDAVEAAVWTLCYGASIGSLRREFGGDEEKIEAWKIICGGKAEMTPAVPAKPL